LAFPKYGEVSETEENMMQYPEPWQAVETQFDLETPTLPRAHVNSSLRQFSLSDYLIIQKWIDYAKGIGDPTSKLFSGLPIKDKQIFQTAQARIKK
jgi:hypothetical protein